ncbi:MAG: thioredoxin family protein [Megasphaera sp.]|nr:thioredoxin family protein [Megasphaera sp.]MCH4187596.1 thioredoxin family protein [Megasphaera sp.]MCH4217859.1 thioredoxin family protein [Megasphaera sp.]
MSEVSVENETDFTLQVLRHPGITVAYFWATWCEPCKMVRAEIKQASLTFKDQVKIVRVNVDTAKDVATQYEIMAVPTLLFFKHGKPLKRIIGYASRIEIEKMINELATGDC